MTDFKSLLEKKVKAASAAAAAAPAASKGVPKAAAIKSAPLRVSEVAEDPTGDEQRRAPEPEVERRAAEGQGRGRATVRGPSNLNRVTVNLFDADRRALAVIKENLTTAGHDFTSRSDSIKIALRIASKAKVGELSEMYKRVKAEDGRHR